MKNERREEKERMLRGDNEKKSRTARLKYWSRVIASSSEYFLRFISLFSPSFNALFTYFTWAKTWYTNRILLDSRLITFRNRAFPLIILSFCIRFDCGYTERASTTQLIPSGSRRRQLLCHALIPSIRWLIYGFPFIIRNSLLVFVIARMRFHRTAIGSTFSREWFGVDHSCGWQSSAANGMAESSSHVYI